MASRKRSADTSPNTVMTNTMVGTINPAAARRRVWVVDVVGASRIVLWRQEEIPQSCSDSSGDRSAKRGPNPSMRRRSTAKRCWRATLDDLADAGPVSKGCADGGKVADHDEPSCQRHDHR